VNSPEDRLPQAVKNLLELNSLQAVWVTTHWIVKPVGDREPNHGLYIEPGASLYMWIVTVEDVNERRRWW